MKDHHHHHSHNDHNDDHQMRWEGTMSKRRRRGGMSTWSSCPPCLEWEFCHHHLLYHRHHLLLNHCHHLFCHCHHPQCCQLGPLVHFAFSVMSSLFSIHQSPHHEDSCWLVRMIPWHDQRSYSKILFHQIAIITFFCREFVLFYYRCHNKLPFKLSNIQLMNMLIFIIMTHCQLA